MSLQFSDVTNKNGIIQLIEFNCAMGDGTISNNATLLKQITGQVNLAMSEIWHIMWAYQNGWQYDDANQTDLPQARFTLQDGVAKYQLPSDALTINRLEVMDSQGFDYPLTPLTERQIQGGIDELLSTDGMPQYYRVIGRTVEMFPAPATNNVTLTLGGKIYFDRTGVAFASTDTTATPGFSGEYHDLVAIKASIKWLQVHKPDSPTLINLLNLEARREAQLREFESGKFKDRLPLTLRGRSNNAR